MTDRPPDVSLPAIRLASLVRRIAVDADRAAFAELFGLLAPKLKGYLMRLGTDDGTAEDLVQDVMLTVWRRAAHFDPSVAAVTTWVWTIARNRRIDRLRRERRPEPDETDFEPSAMEPLADMAIEMAEQQSRLRAAIKELPPEQAELLMMAFYEDKAHGGIAAERGLPLGTVKSRLRLALQRLKKSLQRDSGE